MLSHITLQGDKRERFYSHRFSKEKSNLLYCSQKDPLSNIFFLRLSKNIIGFCLMKIKKKFSF